MLKKIQNHLLINHPIAWNTKVIPLSILLVLLNIIFFIVGYTTTSVNFDETDRNYLYDNEITVNFFVVLVSILALIMWLVYYFKNNSFKSFYPRTNFSLFKEWSITLLISFLLSLFITSFYFGKDVKMRSYYSESETKRRCEILSKGSFFIDGSFSNNYNDSEFTVAEPAETIDTASSAQNYISFKGKKYSWNSLLNKNLNHYSCFDYKSDSVRKVSIQNLLVINQKDSIKRILKNYLSIAKEHKLQANVDESKWFELIYNYPTYENYKIVGDNGVGDYYYPDNYNNNYKFDSINKYIKTINGQQFEYYRYFVPEKNMSYNYTKISDAWNSPIINLSTLLISIYIAIALSLLVFSFRVTSGRNWLIALVGIGVLNILFGILSAIIGSQFSYPILLLSLIILLLFYFIITTSKKTRKQLSGITLNGTLWLLPAIIPLIYFIVLENFKRIVHNTINIDYYKHTLYPTIKFLEVNSINMAYLNIVFILIMMLFFSINIKKWKGIAED
jgi:hypothetical protein